MNIVPKLNLNKHPKDCANNSLVDATNLMFDVDQNVLCNENEVGYDNGVINWVKTRIVEQLHYSGDSLTVSIVGSINCSNEVVYFVSCIIEGNDRNNLIIVRYNQDGLTVSQRYKDYLLIDSPLEYHGGEIIGTFTYNRNNELIIAFSEYKEDNSLSEPLRTLNLDDIEGDKLHSALVPEVTIPRIIEKLYIRKPWYKGQNYIFISFKISDNTYTQWYDLHTNIYNDSFDDRYFINAMLREVPTTGNNKDNISIGRKISMSSKSDICDTSFAITLNEIVGYDYYRLAIINMTKSESKVFCSYDISSNITYVEITADLFANKDFTVDDIIQSYYNYFNVKGITNFKNKLFISNYKENEVDYTDLITKSALVVGTVYQEKIVNADDFIYSNPTNVNSNIEYYIGGRIDGNNYYQLFKRPVTYSIKDSNDNVLNIDDMMFYTEREANLFYDIIWLLYPFTLNNNYVRFNPNNSITSTYINSISTKLLSELSNAYRIHIKFSDNSVINETITSTNDDPYFPHSNIILLPLTVAGAVTYSWYAFKYDSGLGVFKLMKTLAIDSFTIDNIVDGNNDPIVFSMSDIGGYPIMQQVFYDTSTPTAEDQERAQLSIRTLIAGGYYQFYIHYVDKYGNSSLGFPINVNGLVSTYYNKINEKVYQIYENVNPDNNNRMLYEDNKFRVFKLKVKNVQIPNGYVGWYISYAKYENTTTLHGYRLKDTEYYAEQVELSWGPTGGNGRVTGLELDILDSINMNSNRIDFLNIAQAGVMRSDEVYMVKFIPSNSPDNMFRTAYMCINYMTGNTSIEEQVVRLRKVAADGNGKLLLYLNEHKELIPLSGTYYEEYDNNDYLELKNANYNGVISKFEAIVYYTTGIYDTAQGKLMNVLGEPLNAKDLIGYAVVKKWYDYSTYFNESKRYRSNPQIIVNGDYRDENPGFTIGVIAEARDIIDLFENNQWQINEYYPKMDISYYSGDKYKYMFDKTIRRSNVIADESLENSWRRFDTDQYINIKENKGIIMNLVSIGNVFLVHTEHSLFQFDFNDRLTSNGGYVQVDQKDIFDSRYTEQFNSELGFGGLQERHAAICGDFGYIWFNNDFNHFFALSKQGPKIISEDIDNRLRQGNIKNVRFGDDKYRDRVLIKYDINDKVEVLSYNYKLGTFVSFHNYSIVNTNDSETITSNVSWFAYTKKYLYMIFDDNKNVGVFKIGKYSDTRFSIMVSVNYDTIKFLEYIKYRFVRILDSENYDIDYTKLPVEGRYTPEPGNELYVISDECKTDKIILSNNNANASNNFNNDYPYFELGKYNLNKLLNNKTTSPRPNMAGNNSRIFGNYFVFTFVINTTNKQKINIEDFECALVTYRK